MVLIAAATGAADLDLEQRGAELEATAARSGNGPGKLTFHTCGQVNRALLLWNDGFDSRLQHREAADRIVAARRYRCVDQTLRSGSHCNTVWNTKFRMLTCKKCSNHA
jgi:hypothetical protein